MITASEVEVSLRVVLPAASPECLTPLAQLVADALNGVLSPDEAGARLAAEPASALLRPLAGRAIGVGSSVINFGTDNSFGGVSVGDIAGRDIVNLTVYLNLAESPTTHSPDPRAFNMIETVRATVLADQFDERIGEAQDHLDRREYPGAQALVKRLRDRQWDHLSGPQRYKVLAILAGVALAEGKYQDAGRLLLEAKPFQAGEEKHLTNEAVARELLGETGRAFELACVLRREFPDSARALAIWLRTAPAPRGMAELEAEVPEHLAAHEEVATALTLRAGQAGDYERAVTYGRRAAAATDSPGESVLLGEALLKTGLAGPSQVYSEPPPDTRPAPN